MLSSLLSLWRLGGRWRRRFLVSFETFPVPSGLHFLCALLFGRRFCFRGFLMLLLFLCFLRRRRRPRPQRFCSRYFLPHFVASVPSCALCNLDGMT